MPTREIIEILEPPRTSPVRSRESDFSGEVELVRMNHRTLITYDIELSNLPVAALSILDSETQAAPPFVRPGDADQYQVGDGW
jgi:hypothetical protein